MSVRILVGDVRERLAELPDESVHCVVTSPPYFGLRDYGMAGQIGLEETPAAFMAAMVEVFREVRRVLRADGTLWLNLGDSYSSGGRTTQVVQTVRQPQVIDGKRLGATPRSELGDAASGKQEYLNGTAMRPPPVAGLGSKQLLGIPWRVAFALQADGWYLRQDIIWSKPNPMPESVTDRCTKAHEYLFLLSKNVRYFYDAEAIAEDAIGPAGGNLKPPASYEDDPIRNATKAGLWRAQEKARANGGYETRNKRSVWTVSTQSFSEAHFATFPPALIEPCIKAGCPRDCCAKCGAPVVREVERAFKPQGDVSETKGVRGAEAQKPMDESNGWQGFPRGTTTATTLGWSPSCFCNAGLARGTVLDAFGGAGTTGLVADRLGRDAILIELNPAYAAMAERRIRGDSTLFADVTVAECAPAVP